MDSKEFKTVFDEVAKANNFKKAFGGWYKENSECIAILELQKSNFGDYYQLNIKVFIHGIFDKIYLLDKDLMKSSMGHVNSNETKEYKNILDFDELMDDNVRIDGLKELFRKHIVPFTDKTLSTSGIKELEAKGEIYLLPAVKEELFK
ncbi:MAG TPA: DUF4304 domain-containing protein [Bacteroidales bacterium]|jgi:hypothetical protein|nr:DUF4304 domain-containing protein [Bacteroidales bacterium]HQA86750.1 DUF4304 domain-containing protein [Bacteroidales bacterium]